MRAFTGTQRWYTLKFETLAPLHTSLGPDNLLVPDEECDVEDDLTYVIDREALIAELQLHPPALPAPLTYRDVLANRQHPRYETVRREYDLSKQLFSTSLDSPIVEDDVYVTSGHPMPAWTQLALRRPRDLPDEDKLWRRVGGRHLVKYVLHGAQDILGGQEWVEAVARLPRTPTGNILLPGSGLKGAFRSLLIYAVAETLGSDWLERRSKTDGNISKTADLEADLLAPRAPRGGQTPNYDAGRLLILRDLPLEPHVQAALASFGLLGARGWRPIVKGTRQSAAALEVIPPGLAFEGQLGVNELLLWPRHKDDSRMFESFRDILTADLAPLLAAGRAFAAKQLEVDRRFYEDIGQKSLAELVATWLARLAGLPPNMTFLRLGWGAGKLSKTPFAVLLNDGAPFPRSRRLTQGRDGKPAVPFGWVACTVTRAALDTTR